MESAEIRGILSDLGAPPGSVAEGGIESRSPISGGPLGRVPHTSAAEALEAIERARQAFLRWRSVPAPQRGELLRLFAEELRARQAPLGRLVTLEAGKIVSEGLGEVQEMIDICTFATGLSRQLYGLTMASERPQHRMMETWHPLGVVGVVSAFNFPVAVWAWNAALALVCGDAVVWKPSPKTPFCAWAARHLLGRAMVRFEQLYPGVLPEGLVAVLQGGRELAELLADDPRIALLSATGSTAMGRALAPRVAARLGRTLLELGGNNAAIVCASADLDLTLRAVAFSAMGTAGQRCTTLRRLMVHDSIHDELVARLKRVYGSVTVGDPRRPETLVGPLIDEAAYAGMRKALEEAAAGGGKITGGERVAAPGLPGGCYVRPALVEMPEQTEVVRRETFAPILYVLRFRSLEQAVELHNGVPQGLASAIFTRDVQEAERFLSAEGSDCGIVNVNIGPSGAEIGGAFGGEKETGGGRESGSDAWKAYMRRATNTINYGSRLPLAQGVRFDID